MIPPPPIRSIFFYKKNRLDFLAPPQRRAAIAMHLLRVALRDRGYKKIKIITARLGKTTNYEYLLRRNVCLCPAGSKILDPHPRRTADMALLCLQCVARVGG